MTDLEKLKEAEDIFKVAENHFNWADPDYIDKAIKEYNEALENLNNVRVACNKPPMEI